MFIHLLYSLEKSAGRSVIHSMTWRTHGSHSPVDRKSLRFQSVPVYFPGRVPTNVSLRPPRYAVTDYRSGSQLTLYIDGVPAGPYTLPTNHHSKKTAERELLTPFAVVLDVPLCACALAVFIGVLAGH